MGEVPRTSSLMVSRVSGEGPGVASVPAAGWLGVCPGARAIILKDATGGNSVGGLRHPRGIQ
ncbi:hypothetical protein nbrc107697_25540 [Gordonia crocea]|uniref:Uncharacterized protein n=1 Tax=Gordonia crocea TaxID=589162 RepID=A0A7I9UZG8_9ACTN|nr:hypothetical protein nbrc107697_25540 [Gordonia crocea]